MDTLQMNLRAFLILCVMALCCHFAHCHTHKAFPAMHDSVRLENLIVDAAGAQRFMTLEDVAKAIDARKLAPLYKHNNYIVSPKLPIARRYALPSTVAFVDNFSLDFYRTFHYPLVVDSAIRPATTQNKLARHNRCAAPAFGDRASSHERGTTVDISRHMTKAQWRWMVYRLAYYRALGRVHVIEERACWHVMVIPKENQ